MDISAILSVGTGGEVRYPQSYSADENIRLHIPKMAERRFSITPTVDAFTIHGSLGELETSVAGWFKRMKQSVGRLDLTDETHAFFMHMLFIRC